MEPFIRALMLRLEALTTHFSDVYFWLAPEDAALPYAVLTKTPAPTPERATGGEVLSHWPVLINSYCLTAEAAADAVAAIATDLDATVLALAAGTALEANIGSATVELDPDRDLTGPEVWVGIVAVEYTVQRTY